jgi:Spy/CpxP family protein refolding chaperone
MRFSRSAGAMFAALATVAMLAQVSLAQREEGRRRGGREGRFGGGMMSGVRLAAAEPVEKELKLTDEQKDKIKDINDQLSDDMRKAFEDGGDREKIQEINASASAKLKEVLDEGQQKRLRGILVQVAGAAAVADPEIAKELNITEDQKRKLGEVRRESMQAMREAFEGARDQEGGREAMQEKMDKLREDSNKKVMAVLTSDQQAQLEAMKGEKVDIDMSQLRGFGGGRPGGEGRRGGERRERGRGERNPESN